MKHKTVQLLQVIGFFLVFILLTYALARAFSFRNQFSTNEESTLSSSPPVFILDAGHGGIDGGAVAADGTQEKHLNLTLTKHLQTLLECAGMKTILTRCEDELLSLGEPNKRKMQDLRARLNVANANPDAVFVSIHMNNFTQSKYHGLQVYYSPNAPQSESLAVTLQNFTKFYLQPENERLCKEANSSIYLMHRMENVGVLVECGFLSNENELLLLKTETYQKQLAFVIAASLMEFTNTSLSQQAE